MNGLTRTLQLFILMCAATACSDDGGGSSGGGGAGGSAGSGGSAGGEPPAPEDAIQVTGSGLRGCDVLFAEGETAVRSVSFAEGVVGEWIKRDGVVALSFVGANGAEMGNVGAIRLQSGDIAGAGDLETLELSCFGENGAALNDAQIAFK
ncbi:MAG: hypothetical protein ACE366_18960 [Bradymonadia bacterium]